MSGVEEEAVVFHHPAAFTGLDRFRRFGSDGPLYEILGQSGERVRIRVVESGEEVEYPMQSAQQDPLA